MSCIIYITEIIFNNNKLLAQKSQNYDDLVKAIYKNKYVINIELANVSMTDDNCLLLMPALSTCTHLKKLNLETNYLSSMGITAVAKMMEAHPTLEEVRIANQRSSVGVEAEKAIANALSQNPRLLKLSFVCRERIVSNYINKFLSRNNDLVRQQRSKSPGKPLVFEPTPLPFPPVPESERINQSGDSNNSSEAASSPRSPAFAFKHLSKDESGANTPASIEEKVKANMSANNLKSSKGTLATAILEKKGSLTPLTVPSDSRPTSTDSPAKIKSFYLKPPLTPTSSPAYRANQSSTPSPSKATYLFNSSNSNLLVPSPLASPVSTPTPPPPALPDKTTGSKFGSWRSPATPAAAVTATKPTVYKPTDAFSEENPLSKSRLSNASRPSSSAAASRASTPNSKRDEDIAPDSPNKALEQSGSSIAPTLTPSLVNSAKSDRTPSPVRSLADNLDKALTASRYNMVSNDLQVLIERLNAGDATLTSIQFSNTKHLSQKETNYAEFAHALLNNTYLTNLELANCSMKDEHCLLLMTALATCTQLKKLNLETNYLTTVGVSATARMMEAHPTLEEVRIANQRSSVGVEAEKAIANALSQNPRLLKLSFVCREPMVANNVNKFLSRNNDLVRQQRAQSRASPGTPFVYEPTPYPYPSP